MDSRKIQEIAKEARPTSRLAKMMRGKNQGREVLWPGTDVHVYLRPLSCAEVLECYAAAHKVFAALELPPSGFLLDPYQDELATQILFRACRDPEKPEKPLAIDADDLRDNTTPDERSAMMALYTDLLADVDPALEELSPEIARDIADAVKKKAARTLRRFGSSMLASYLLTTGEPPATSPTGR